MPKKIVILGGGTAGWMAANLFAQRWSPAQVVVEVVESPDIGIIGVGEGSTPFLERFFRLIGVDDADWMPRCNATYKLGISFAGWSPASGIDSYSHPFLSQVDHFTERAFVTNCRTRRLGLDVNTQPDDFFLNSLLVNERKGPKAPENFPFIVGYGYHFDAGLLGRFLGELAAARGVTHTQTRVVDVEMAEDGNIASLLGEDGARIEADMFVDCTGFGALLMRKSLGVEFRSFKSNLFNDSAVVMPTPAEEAPRPETVSTALSNGWCWKIPLTNRFGNGYVYSADFISPDDAETELRTHLGLLDSSEEARHLKMNVGQLERHWEKNCLALGLSQGFIEPLEATALLLVQQAIEMFIARYEQGNFTPEHRDDFNARITERFERVRDYIVAHYKLNTRDDTEYWCANRQNMELSDSLRRILDAWYRREDVAQEIQRQNIESHFTSASWHCLLAGYGAFPALADNQPGQGDLYEENGIAEFLRRCSLNFASHKDNLAALGA